jgi:hypothetical protein
LLTAGGTPGPVTVTATATGVNGTAIVTIVGDTQSPSTPSGLMATAVSSTVVNLTWAASTDNIGVTGYEVLRCQGAGCTPSSTIATPTATSYSNAGLSASTPYVYAVRARDAAGNRSAASSTATAVTLAPPTASFVQVAYAVPGSAQTISMTYPGAQTAGDLNVVAIGWSGTTEVVQSVTDGNGNDYVQAMAPTRSDHLTQVIYYARNIAPGSNNAVTVTFNTIVNYPDLRILEYSGVSATATVNQTASSFDNSNMTTAAQAGPVATDGSGQLVFAAGMTNNGFTYAMNGFTVRIISQPDADVAEDLVSTGAGSYTAAATLNTMTEWLLQVVSFH